jgi:hypothetical protein
VWRDEEEDHRRQQRLFLIFSMAHISLPPHFIRSRLTGYTERSGAGQQTSTVSLGDKPSINEGADRRARRDLSDALRAPISADG